MKKAFLTTITILLLLAIAQMAGAAPVNPSSADYLNGLKNYDPDAVILLKDIVKFKSCGKQRAEELSIPELQAIQQSPDYSRLSGLRTMSEATYKQDVKALCKP